MNAKDLRDSASERNGGKKKRKQDEIYGCLFNRAVELHYPRRNINCETDVGNGSITQVFLFCAMTGETMTGETMSGGSCSACPVALFLFTVIHALPLLFLLVSITLRCSALLSWCHSEVKCHRHKCFVILLLISLPKLERPSFWCPDASTLCLSERPSTQSSKFNGPKWDV